MSHSRRTKAAVIAMLIALPVSVVLVILGYQTGILWFPYIFIFGLDGSNHIPNRYHGVIIAGVTVAYVLAATPVVALPIYILVDIFMPRKKTQPETGAGDR